MYTFTAHSFLRAAGRFYNVESCQKIVNDIMHTCMDTCI